MALSWERNEKKSRGLHTHACFGLFGKKEIVFNDVEQSNQAIFVNSSWGDFIYLINCVIDVKTGLDSQEKNA